MSNKYLNFIDIALQVTRYSHLPLYSCKYSKQTYTLHQLLTLVLFKEYLGEDYRDFVDLVELMSSIQTKLGLTKVPHFTTLQKLLLESIQQYLIVFSGGHWIYFTRMESQLKLLVSIQLVLQVGIVATTILGESKNGDEAMLKPVFQLMFTNL